MDNPLSGIMEWYQGLPQAAQIGIPVVGVGAVFLISRKGGGTGSLVSGPFGSSTGGGQAASGAANSGGSDGGGSSPSPKPKPKPGPHPKPIPPVRPPKPRPVPPGGHKPLPPIRPVTRPKPEPIKPKVQPLQKGHLPSSHIQQHPALSHPHLPSSHIMSTPLTKAAAVSPRTVVTPKTPLAGIRSGSLYEGGPTKVTASKVTMAPAHHPVANRGLHNTVPASKSHQHLNDQHRNAASTLAQRSNRKPIAL